MNENKMELRNTDSVEELSQIENESLRDYFELHQTGELFESQSAKFEAELSTEVETFPPNTEAREKAESVLEQFRQVARKNLYKMMASILLAAPQIASATDVEVDPHNTTEASEQVQSVETEMETSRRAQRTFDRLASSVWEDDHETQYIHFGIAGDEKKLNKAVGETGAYTVNIGDKEIMRIDKKFADASESGTLNTSRLILQHNHPISLIAGHYGLGAEQITAMENGEIPRVVAPPSTMDLFNAEHIAHNQVGVISQIAGPSGSWEITYDEEHVMTKLRRQHGVQSPQLEELILEETGYSLNILVLNIVKTAEEIRTESIAGHDVSGLINEYIDKCKQIGINISYTPH